MLLKACLNGARRPAEHPALPITPEQLAMDVRRVVAAGVRAVHVHAKDAEGADTLAAPALARVLEAIRSTVPDIGIGATTGAWAMPDPEQRVAAIGSWTELPDFASVNWHETGADEVAAALLRRGVGVEAGLWHREGADAWLASTHRDRCCRVMVELPDGLDPAATQAEAERLLAQLGLGNGERRLGRIPVLLHGEGTSCWPALKHAGRRGLQVRIGLEDVLVLPDGSPAPDNASLVVAARDLLRATPVS